MSYAERKTKEQASRVKVHEVATTGAALGLWKIVAGHQPAEGDTWRWIEVETPDGSRFDIRGGSWGREGSISMDLSTLKGPHGLAISPRDVLRYQQTAPEASASHARTAEAIAKDLNRRVSANPEALEIAALMREALARKAAQRGALAAHVAALEAKGYRFNQYQSGETYRARGWRDSAQPLHDITVDYMGRIEASVVFDIPQLDALTALLAAPST